MECYLGLIQHHILCKDIPNHGLFEMQPWYFQERILKHLDAQSLEPQHYPIMMFISFSFSISQVESETIYKSFKLLKGYPMQDLFNLAQQYEFGHIHFKRCTKTGMQAIIAVHHDITHAAHQVFAKTHLGVHGGFSRQRFARRQINQMRRNGGAAHINRQPIQPLMKPAPHIQYAPRCVIRD